MRRLGRSVPFLAGALVLGPLVAHLVACGGSAPPPLGDRLLSAGGTDAGTTGSGSAMTSSSAADSAPPFTFDTSRFDHVAAALTTSYVIRPDGTLYGWGNTDWGQLFEYDEAAATPGVAITLPVVPHPIALGADSDWQHISAAGDHACGLRAGGRLFCWGDNEFGESGPAGGSDFVDAGRSFADPWATYMPAAVPGTWDLVVAGCWHTCGLQSDGTAWCWGRNDIGQVGDGTGSGTTFPTSAVRAVVGGAQWKTLAAGFGDTCGIQVDGSLWCWGDNDFGQLGALVPSSVATNAGGATSDYGPRGDGASAPVRVGTRSDWDLVAIGYHEACASEGPALYCWGGAAASAEVVEPRTDGLPLGAILFATATAGGHWARVAISMDQVIAVDSSGAMSTGPADEETATYPGAPAFAPMTFADVSTSYDSACALGADAAQTVYCWGLLDDDATLGQGEDAGARTAPTEVPPF